jgi:ribulose-phosphate 3-epimerase
MSKFLSASILSADILSIKSEIKKLEEAGLDMIHIDIMDGHFVQHITFGHNIVKQIRAITNLKLDVHLMLSNPEQHIADFALAGADFLTIHLEATRHLDRVLRQIKSFGVKAGVALLPSTLPNSIDYVADLLDIVVVMSVNPGFAGQEFLDSQLEKIKVIASRIPPSTLLSVDGGINDKTITKASSSGANTFVSGNYLFSDRDLATRVATLRALM